MKMLSPLNDFVFKALFGREDATSKQLLIDLLNDTLRAKGEDLIVSIQYLNPFNYKEHEFDRLSVLDIKAQTEKGERVNIEVQVKPEVSYRKRSLYYWARTYAETIGEAEPYEELKKTIVINIMDYEAISESKKLHTHFKLLEREEYFTLTEDLQIHYLEVPKLTKDIEELEGIELWIAFLKEAGRVGNEEKIEKLKRRSESMSKAIESLETVSADEKMLEAYRAREKARRDEISKIAYAEKQGIKLGKIETAEKAFRNGANLAFVVEITDLPLEKLREIEEKVKSEQSN
ncbi:putative transposase/invertase (TIGR01784 family) [Desulfitispora alkaliphila]|uniref:Rpn family recombination-promoting nuclease/putative transposase n=1 Tax=Desulfitispora alkaliphila TaxID=622674 RepID=UPI003D1A6BBD